MAEPSKLNLWGVIGLAVGALLLISATAAACAWLYKQGDAAGYQRRGLEQAQAENAALKAAQAKVAQLTQQLQETERQIYEESKNDGAVLPDSTRRQLERMRDHQRVRDGESR